MTESVILLKATPPHLANGDMPFPIPGDHHSHRGPSESSHDDMDVLPAFEFSTTLPPSIITEGSQGGPWRKKATDLDGTEDEKELPKWCIDCVIHGQIPPREHAKYIFFTAGAYAGQA